MDKYELQKLRDLPIEGVAERLGLQVARHKALCPFHADQNPSLSFNVRKNTCRCFVCMNESMGTIDLVMKYLHKDFRESCEWLGGPSFQEEGKRIREKRKMNESIPNPSLLTPNFQEEGKRIREKGKMNESIPNSSLLTPNSFNPSRYSRFFEHPCLSAEACRFLFDERHLDPRVVRWCRVSSWCDRNGMNWLQIPYYDENGKLIGVQNRNLQKGATPRFKFPYGSRCGIYNLQIVSRLKEGDELWITEGSSDCWAMLSSGRKAIAIPSATLLSPKNKELLVSLSSSLSLRWSMYPDRDVPGELLFCQLKSILPELQHHQLPEDCKDYSDYYVQYGHQTL